jgi:heterodisulfide reductase subunit C
MPKGWKEWEEEVKKYPPKEGPLYKAISSDFRFHQAVKNCMRCGTCVSICPAAHFNDYSPREVIRIMMDGVDEEILELCREKIYHCAQCHYCIVRCPRRNQPAHVIMILREYSHEWGLTVEAMKPFTRVLKCILMTGTQISPDMIQGDFFPDWGPKTRRMGHFMGKLRKDLGSRPEGYKGLRGVEVLAGVEAAWKVRRKTIHELQRIWQMDGSLERVRGVSPFLAELIEEELEEYEGEED